MKKTFFSTLAALCAASCASLYADNYSDLAAYKAGESLSWFYELRGESLNRSKSAQIERNILGVLAEKKIDDGAFKRACEILKPIASEKSVGVLAKFLGDDFRTPWVCDVFITLDSSSVDGALASALDGVSKKCKMSILSTLASRGSSEGFEAVKKYADSQDAELAAFAVSALVKFQDSDAVEVLSSVVAKNDARKDAALDALSMIAYRAAKRGDKSLAKEALESVPADYGMSIAARAELAGNDRVKYLDSIIIADGKNVNRAGRLVYKSRKFEDSGALVAAFPKLSKKAKLAAVASFMLSGDTRFYPTVAPLLDSPDADLRDEAVYSARFICTDETNLRKIYALIGDKNRIISSHARNVFEENPSFAAVRILKEAEAKGDLDALSFLVLRGDIEAREKLKNMYFAGEYKNPKISQMLESLITYGEMPAFAAKLKSADEELRKDMTKIIIKKLAKCRDKLFVAEAASEILDGNLSPDDPTYKFIASKLKVKPQKRKAVWQGEYRPRAVEDRFMKIAQEGEPDIENGFVSMFDGKTLDGWKTSTGNAKYSVEDGCILGVTDPKMKQNSFLVSERADYKDFIFTCEFKWLDLGNSGVIFRGQVNENGRIVGPQAEMDSDPKRRWTGGIYNEGAAWMYSLSRREHERARNAVDLFGWNRMTIKCQGDRMQTWINGVPVSDLEWKEADKGGFFGLQIHTGKKCKVLWRNIKIRELK